MTFAQASAAPVPVTIRFRDAATVEGGSIRLGDIARIMAGAERAVAELEKLEVGKAAGFGLTRSIDTETLFLRHLQPLAARYLVDYDRKQVRVTTRAEVLSSDSLARLIDAFLASQPKREGETWRWEIVRAPQDLLLPVTGHSLELAFAGLKRKGKIEISLSIKAPTPGPAPAPGRTLRTLPITINLRVEEPVLVARRAIARDSVLDASSVSLEMRETTHLNETAMGDPRRMLGLLAKVSIAPGRVITPRLVAVPPVVRRGQGAKIVYKSGSVTIAADAVCRQDGAPGEIITAVSIATRRLMRVRVVEAGVLEPVPGG